MKLFGATDIGCVRNENQDSYAVQEWNEVSMLVVCDGMGGARAGNVASSTAVEAFVSAVDTALANGVPDSVQTWENLLTGACQTANQRVYELSQSNENYHGMGTTLVAALILPEEAYVVNVGDSRCYLLERETIRQVTSDHSWVQHLVDRGEITAEEARTHPKKNLITRALGVDRSVECDVFQVRCGPGCRFLLCSDGLSNMLPDEIMGWEAANEPDPQRLAEKLLNMALGQGAPDNVTVVLAQL